MVSYGGTLLGRFKVAKTLGFGGMSEVVLARDLVLNEDVALKIIHPHLARYPRTIERFRREVEICRIIAHPGIAAVRELHESPGEGLIFLSMEYLPGGDLESRISRAGVLPESELTRIAVKLLEALEAAHAAGIVHRDIKPHNILFDALGEPRLTDFGLARIGFGEAGRDGAVGTPEYCPPESAAGRHGDLRGDLYSLGVTLFEAATGKLPFAANDPLVLLSMKTRQEAPLLRSLNPSCSEALEGAVAKALERDPEARFQTAKEFREALSSAREAGNRLSSLPMGTAGGRHAPRCPICGGEIQRSLPHCFRCGKTAASIEAAEGKSKARSVVVLGSGKPGDKLSPEERAACLSLVRTDGIDASKLEKAIPRTPFRLIGGLSEGSAESLISSLVSRGIGAVAPGPGNGEGRRASLKAFTKKVLALSPRLLLIILGSMGGFYNNVWRLFSRHGGLSAIIAISAAILIFVPGAVALGNLTRYAKISGGRRGKQRWSILSTALDLDLPAFRDLAVSLAKKLDALSGLLEAGGGLPDDIERELCAAMDGGVSEWSRTILAIQEAERSLMSESAAGEDAFDASGRRERELFVDSGYARILKFASALDGMIIKLGSIQAGRVDDSLGEIERSTEDLDDLRKAFLEIEGATEGRES